MGSSATGYKISLVVRSDILLIHEGCPELCSSLVGSIYQQCSTFMVLNTRCLGYIRQLFGKSKQSIVLVLAHVATRPQLFVA